MDALGGDPRPKHGRDAILSRHNRAVRERSANVRDHARGPRKQRSSGRGGDRGHEYVAGFHLRKVLRAVYHAGLRGDAPRAGGNPLDQVAF